MKHKRRKEAKARAETAEYELNMWKTRALVAVSEALKAEILACNAQEALYALRSVSRDVLADLVILNLLTANGGVALTPSVKKLGELLGP